jgi:pimeloyl-ACP methyl ester carboxylesterase
MSAKPNVVLVHGAWADGSSWSVMGEPAWKSLPTWYLVTTNDEAIPPGAERMVARRMGTTTVEVASSHVAMVSHPNDVVQLIEAAAEAVGGAGSQAVAGGVQRQSVS